MKKILMVLFISIVIAGCSTTVHVKQDGTRTEQRSQAAFDELDRSTK